jgi:hypothetical protein
MNKRKLLLLMGGSVRPTQYLLRDDFTGLLANGEVNGTSATPGPGTRTTVQAGGAAITIPSSGTLKIVGGSNHTDLFALDAQTRAAGLAMGYKFTLADADADTASRRIGFDPDHLLLVSGDTSMTTKFGAKLENGTYYAIIVLRASGADCYFKGGAFAEWTLVDRQIVGSTATLTPIAKVYHVKNFYVNTVRLLNLSWLTSPVTSDGFGGTFGTTDGLGHAEGIAGGLGIGGSGLTYTQVGTWGNAAGVASCGTLDTGVGKAVVDGGVVDVLHEATITRSAGTMGVIVRYADANNYVYAYILNDGENKATIRKVVGGTDSEVLAPTAITYAAAKVLRVQALATKFRLFYNNTLIGAEQTISDAGLQTGTKVGLYTTDTGNTFDNMQTLSMVDSEYDSKFANFFLA